MRLIWVRTKAEYFSIRGLTRLRIIRSDLPRVVVCCRIVARMSVAICGTGPGVASLARATTSPRIDTRPLPGRARFRLRHRAQAGHDPLTRVGGVDYFVDLQHGGDRDRLAVGIELRDLGLVVLLALVGILDCFHFLAEAEPHIALQHHAAELAGRPGHREERGME